MKYFQILTRTSWVRFLCALAVSSHIAQPAFAFVTQSCIPKAADAGEDTLWEILDRIQAIVASASNTMPTQVISQAAISGGGFTINQPGKYILCEDLFNDGFALPVIIVDSGDVWLDLNGYSITTNSQTNTPTAAIFLTGNANRVVVDNGSIRLIGDPNGQNTYGIHSYGQAILLRDLTVLGTDPTNNPNMIGIGFGDANNASSRSIAQNINVFDVGTGFAVINASDITLLGCNASRIVNGFGFLLLSPCAQMILYECTAQNVSGSPQNFNSIAGFAFVADQGAVNNIIVEKCMALECFQPGEINSGDGFRAEITDSATDVFQNLIFKKCVSIGNGLSGIVFLNDNSFVDLPGDASAELYDCLCAHNDSFGLAIDLIDQNLPATYTDFVVRSCTGLDNNIRNFFAATSLEGAYNNYANLSATDAYQNFNHTINLCRTGFLLTMEDDIIFSNYYHNAYADPTE